MDYVMDYGIKINEKKKAYNTWLCCVPTFLQSNPPIASSTLHWAAFMHLPQSLRGQRSQLVAYK